MEVITQMMPCSNRAANRRPRIIASAMSLTWNSSKHSRRTSREIRAATVFSGSASFDTVRSCLWISAMK
ncbi:hypothetical protein D3C72_2099990 [compost metagenome]